MNKNKLINLVIGTVISIGIIVFIAIKYDEISVGFYETFIEHDNYKVILDGLLNTCIIAVGGLLIGIVIGVIISVVSSLSNDSILILVLKKLFNIYVAIMRGTPLAVQLLIFYFIIFWFIQGGEVMVATLVMGLNSGAYVSEILRGGINSVPIGQKEAGLSLGLTENKTMMKIVIPQAFKNTLPSIGNEFISLIKETSIVGFLGAMDLTQVFRKIAASNFKIEVAYISLGITYFIIILIITKLLKIVERGMSKNDRT